MIWNTYELYASYLSRATAIFVVDCCQFGPSWIFGLEWSLWPVPAWLEVQRIIAVFFLTLYDSINDMKYWQTVCITPQPCYSHFCCWLLPIWPKLDYRAKNGAYGLRRIGWQNNGTNLSSSWPNMIVSMIWNTSETLCITPQPCHSHFCCWLLPIWP